MPRPHKCRRIRFAPKAFYFKPAGIPAPELEQVTLTLDETEALRLADHMGQEQEKAAAGMRVSRQTFGNILRSARGKAADCLVNGKALRIEGGKVVLLCGCKGNRRAGGLCGQRLGQRACAGRISEGPRTRPKRHRNRRT
ncbi:MAG: DUF134 domain-containing protein [Elusimicrobiales bacterium]